MEITQNARQWFVPRGAKAAVGGSGSSFERCSRSTTASGCCLLPLCDAQRSQHTLTPIPNHQVQTRCAPGSRVWVAPGAEPAAAPRCRGTHRLGRGAGHSGGPGDRHEPRQRSGAGREPCAAVRVGATRGSPGAAAGARPGEGTAPGAGCHRRPQTLHWRPELRAGRAETRQQLSVELQQISSPKDV